MAFLHHGTAMSLTQEQALRAYATMMNTLDASHLVPLLADSFGNPPTFDGSEK